MTGTLKSTESELDQLRYLIRSFLSTAKGRDDLIEVVRKFFKPSVADALADGIRHYDNFDSDKFFDELDDSTLDAYLDGSETCTERDTSLKFYNQVKEKLDQEKK